MTIVGYNITSVTADKRNPTEQKLDKIDINSIPHIVKVEEKEVTFVKKEVAIAIGFEFITTYSPNIGEIRINGEIMFTTPDTKRIVKYWEKEKKLPEDADIEIKNFLFRKCLGIGINLSEDMQLPPPLGFPTIVKETKEDDSTKYIG